MRAVHWGEQSVLTPQREISIQMLISFKNTLTGKAKIMFDKYSGVFGSVQLTHDVKQHRLVHTYFQALLVRIPPLDMCSPPETSSSSTQWATTIILQSISSSLRNFSCIKSPWTPRPHNEHFMILLASCMYYQCSVYHIIYILSLYTKIWLLQRKLCFCFILVLFNLLNM